MQFAEQNLLSPRRGRDVNVHNCSNYIITYIQSITNFRHFSINKNNAWNMALSLQLFPRKYCGGNKYIVIREWPSDKLNRICYPGVYFTSSVRYYFYVGLGSCSVVMKLAIKRL
jgi:hypothetical protein